MRKPVLLATWNPARECWEGGTSGPVLRALGRVLGDLASLGYDAQWATVGASDVGAPHHRERVFVLAVRGGVEDAVCAGSGRWPVVPVSRGAGGADVTADWASVGLDASGIVTRLAPWGEYAAAIRRWEHTFGRPAPTATERVNGQRPRLSARFVEWMMGLPDGWVTGVPGLTRSQQLTMLGNGVVPQQAEYALTGLCQWAGEGGGVR